MNTMRVSVIIPAYRAAATIRRAIDSVLAQTHPVHEIIVVDDGSPDEQVSLVQAAYGDRVMLIGQPHGGAARARNCGIERSSGDVIAFLDADDYWEPMKIEHQLAILERHPEVALIAGRWFEQQPGGERYVAREPDAGFCDRILRHTGPMAFYLATIVWTGTVLICRDALGDARFVPGLEPAEDRDLWVRVIDSRAIWLQSQPLATAVLQHGSLSRSSIDRDCRSMLNVIERHRARLGPNAARLWRAYVLFLWASDDRMPGRATVRLLHSLLLWPRPFGEISSAPPFVRLKRLAVLFAIAVKVRRVDTRLQQ